MKPDKTTSLLFAGDLALWQGILLAAVLAVLVWMLYRREVNRGLQKPLSWLLPLLRTTAFVLLILTLTGPVLHHREKIGQLGRVLLFVDGSKSMSVDDAQMMSKPRKLLVAQQSGWIPDGTVDTTLAEAADEMGTASSKLSKQLRGSRLTLDSFLKARSEFKGRMEDVRKKIDGIRVDTPEPELRQGVVYREVWEGINGGSVSNLTGNAKFREEPTSAEYISSLSSPKNIGDNYGQRISGFIIPPLTGNYVFTLSSDDEAFLYLNATGNAPNGKKQLIKSPSATPRSSQPIALKAETRCYVEILMKEAGGDDFVTVGWNLPNGDSENPIPANRLASPTASSNFRKGSFEAIIKKYHTDILKQIDTSKLPKAGDSNASDRLRAILIAVSGKVKEYENFLRNTFLAQGEALANSGNAIVTAALDKFDDNSRWERTKTILSRDSGLLSTLVDTHDVEVFALKGSASERLWSPGDTTEKEFEFEGEADELTTNLSSGIGNSLSADIGGDGKNAADPDTPPQRTAVIIFSDGLHNDGESPIHTAKLFGGRNIAVHTIGMGGNTPPPDLAILEVENPEAVYMDDRIQGTLFLKDNIEKGRAFQIRIEHEGRLVWEKKLFTHNLQRRRIPFDFGIKEIVEEEIKRSDKSVDISSLPLSMKVIVDPLEEEARKDNNEAPLVFKAVTRKHRMLIIDGRPRWETRYVRNLFDRGKRWEVNSIFAGPATDTANIPRGEAKGQFPKNRDTLFAYDLIIFGEAGKGLLNDTELVWIRDFVEKRGGGIIFIDGPRQKLKSLVGTPVLDMVPVEWVEGADLRFPKWLQVTERGASRAALSLVSDPSENERLWRTLPQPHWVSPVKALPGTDVLLEAAVGDIRSPVLVYRNFGAGKVFYSGFDGSWRWRYGVADRYHQKYWHQVAEWIMEQPFAVSDDHVSIDAGATVYQTGDSANIRVRLRDSEGKPINEATAEALIWKDGRITSRVSLESDANAGGLFTGKSAALNEGQHQVTVRVTGFSEDQTKARTEFVVQQPDSGETALLACNEALLQDISRESGGQYLREEQASQLSKVLDPLSTGKIVESDTIIWQSYWWFAAIIALLGTEWFLRKRAGMI